MSRKIRLLKRRQVIKLWNRQGDKHLNSLCCPYCRDLLEENDEHYECNNMFCDFDTVRKEDVIMEAGLLL